MIELPRSLARRLHAVLRRCFTRTAAGVVPAVALRRSPSGLTVEAVGPDVAVRLEVPGPGPEAVLTFRGEVLAQVGAKTNDVVTLRAEPAGQVHVSWLGDGGRHDQAFPAVAADAVTPFPLGPEGFQPQPVEFLSALVEATKTTNPKSGRPALRCPLWRGKAGQVVATDGKQLLAQAGFSFPWDDDVLVPALTVWDSRDLGETLPLAVGRQGAYVFVRVGPWTFALRSEPPHRYPDWEPLVPKTGDVNTRVRFGPEDVPRLLRELPRLPGADDDHQPITLRLDRAVVVAAQGAGQAGSTELPLPASQYEGRPVAVVTNRRLLARALRLGLTELEVVSPAHPVCSRDATRTFLWMPLDPKDVAPRRDHQLNPHQESPVTDQPNSTSHTGNGHAGSAVDTPLDPLAEAEALRAQVQEVQTRLGRLIAALKQHRRQAKAVQAAVASLRHLPPLAP